LSFLIITDTPEVNEYAEKFSFEFYSYPTMDAAYERLAYISLLDLEAIVVVLAKIPVRGTLKLLSKIHMSNPKRSIECVFVSYDIQTFVNNVNMQKLKDLKFKIYYNDVELLSDQLLMKQVFGGILLNTRTMYQLDTPESNKYLAAQRKQLPSMYFRPLLNKDRLVFDRVVLQQTYEGILSSESKHLNTDIQRLRDIVVRLSFDRYKGAETPNKDLVREFVYKVLDENVYPIGERVGVLGLFDDFLSKTYASYDFVEDLI
jgi:hypothetical protein